MQVVSMHRHHIAAVSHQSSSSDFRKMHLSTTIEILMGTIGNTSTLSFCEKHKFCCCIVSEGIQSRKEKFDKDYTVSKLNNIYQNFHIFGVYPWGTYCRIHHHTLGYGRLISYRTTL